MEFLTDNKEQTEQLGFSMARDILSGGDIGKAIIVSLDGELGAGKTTFLQGFAKGLGIRGRVNSPTFNIMNHYRIKDTVFKDYYHLDCYRIEVSDSMDFMDMPSMIKEKSSIICIEWGGNISDTLPYDRINISFKVLVGDKRKIVISGKGIFSSKEFSNQFDE
jgi:tRNA threonylcarbamoyladenosine biosynthesis protein TsaE